MSEEPTVIERSEQPYVALRARMTMPELGEVLPPLAPQVYRWLSAHEIPPAGPCFWKYNEIDMSRELEVEVGVPVAEPVSTDGPLIAGLLPGGRYASVTHVGHPDTLEGATRDLLVWAEAQGLAFDVTEADGADHWAARLEEYLNDPDDGVDMAEWTTNLYFRLTQ